MALRADVKGVTVQRGAHGVGVPFACFSAAEAYELLFDDLVEKDASLKADAIEFLLFLGLADRALELAQGLPEARPRQTRARPRTRASRRPGRILSDVRDLAQRAQSDETALGRLYREVTRLIDEFADTRAYLLNRRSPPAGPPGLEAQGPVKVGVRATRDGAAFTVVCRPRAPRTRCPRRAGRSASPRRRRAARARARERRGPPVSRARASRLHRRRSGSRRARPAVRNPSAFWV